MLASKAAKIYNGAKKHLEGKQQAELDASSNVDVAVQAHAELVRRSQQEGGAKTAEAQARVDELEAVTLEAANALRFAEEAAAQAEEKLSQKRAEAQRIGNTTQAALVRRNAVITM